MWKAFVSRLKAAVRSATTSPVRVPGPASLATDWNGTVLSYDQYR